MKIHLNDGSPLPTDPNYFVVAGNGIFLKKQTGWVEALVPVRNIDGLERITPTARLLLPSMPSIVFAKAVRFFHIVYERQGTESAVLLHFDGKNGWEITAPEQKATSVHVDYKMTERLPGYQCVGTMHSHCAMSAFHSGTDTRDEADMDGIHITIGRLDRYPFFSMDGEFVVNGTRFPLPDNKIVRLMRLPQVEEPEPIGMQKDHPFLRPPPRDKIYTLPHGILHRTEIPEEWVTRVKGPGGMFSRAARRLRKQFGRGEAIGADGGNSYFPNLAVPGADQFDFKEDTR